MKTTKLLIMAGLLLCTTGTWSQDTTLIIDNKRIVMEDDGERLKMRVFQDGEESQLIFEGHYRNGQSFERRERAIHIPLPFQRRRFDPHWSGFSVGFAGVANGLGLERLNDVGDGRLLTDASMEYNFNFYEKAVNLSKDGNWAIVSGLGMRWTRYRVDGASYFLNVDGYTSLHPVPEEMDFRRARLNITSLTIPVLLEWQSRRNIFVSAGMVGVVKTMSSSKVLYHNSHGKKETKIMDKGMNLFPVRMEFVLQAGFDWIGAYVRYSPMGLFENGRGPKVYPVAIGLQLHF